MMKIFSVVLICLFYISDVFAQETATFRGRVIDAATKEPLIGANVVAEPGVGNVGETKGTVTDLEGNYVLVIPAGVWWIIDIKFIGYERERRRIKPDPNTVITHSVALSMEALDLGLVTVSTSKYEKKFGEESVSMEVLTPQFIQNTNATSLDAAIDKVPGVNMVGETVNIRGGAGYSANAGSRVLMLLDGIPWLTPHNSGIEYWALPLEETKQIEIIKGASSTLYGSSALNGTINMITENPKEKPYSRLLLFTGLYENPLKGEQKDLYWADRPRLMYGGAFVHRRKFKEKYDFAVNGAYNTDESHLLNDTRNRMRLFVKNRYRASEKVTLGLNVNAAYEFGDFYFLWADFRATGRSDSLNYVLDAADMVDIKQFLFNMDPYLTYFDKKGNKHHFKGRYYMMATRIGNGEDTDGGLGHGEYTFHGSLKVKGVALDFVTGASASHSMIDSKIFNKRTASNAAAFFQMDTKLFDKLTLTGGIRAEVFKLDSLPVTYAQPVVRTAKIPAVLRAGVNYEAAKASYIRASFGMGYRYPSIAEKFVQTVRAGQYTVPNVNLQSESSWSAELGFKQGFKISKWFGYLDLAAFVTQYKDMMEFTVAPTEVKNQYYPTSVLFAFWSDNVTDARISGLEFSALGQGQIFGVTTNFLVGYTYLNPIDLNFDPDLPKYNNRTNTLNFRFKHSAKADLECSYKQIRFGATGFINSFMENIDQLINLAASIQEWRLNHKEPSYSVDARIGYNFNEDMRVVFIAKNVTNNLYSIRPGYIEAPRNYTLQLSYEF